MGFSKQLLGFLASCIIVGSECSFLLYLLPPLHPTPQTQFPTST